ncbi:MAG: SgcJ/EcaC family oxidoreductase [Gemmatimonadota bacterium]
MLRILKLTFLFIATGFFAFACSQEPAEETGAMDEETVVVDVAAEEAAIEALADTYAQAVAAKDLETLVGLWTEDATATEYDGTVTAGHDGLRAYYTEQFSAEGTPSFEIVPDRRVVSSSGDVAYETGTYTFTMTGTDGATQSSSHGYAVGFRKIDGTWKLDFSFDTAPLVAGETVPATAEAPAE